MDEARELARRHEAASEGLFDHQPPARARRPAKSPYDRREHARWNGQVADGSLRAAERGAESVEGRGIAIVALDISHVAGEGGEGVPVDPSVACQAVADEGAQALDAPASARNADHGHVEFAASNERLQCRIDLPLHQITGGAEQDQGVRPVLRSESNGAHFTRSHKRSAPVCRSGQVNQYYAVGAAEM